jgi:serine protease Do
LAQKVLTIRPHLAGIQMAGPGRLRNLERRKVMRSEEKITSPQNGTKQLGFRHGLAIGIGMFLLLLGGALGFMGARERTNASAATPETIQSSPAASSPVDGLSSAFERVAKLVEPGVVNISTEQVIHSNGLNGFRQDQFEDMFGGNSPFGFFFNQPRDLKQKSLGSGLIVDPRGYILTNNHVVNNATKIKVKLQDGRSLDGKVVGTDEATDLAVIKVNASNLPTLKLANSDQVKVGEWVLAFGSPFGLEQTMTAGIISAKGRAIGEGDYNNFLQTDAAINPGNSGGPLVNLQGEVVGINTMILSQSGGFQGVGLAIPGAMADNVYKQLITSGKVTRGWLGVSIQEITPELAKSFNLDGAKGVLVADVKPGSPAAKAGLRSGDVIIEYNGKETKNPRDLSMAVADTKVGVPAKLTVLRGGKTMSMEIAVGEKPAERAENNSPVERQDHAKLGLTVENVDPDSARQLNLSSQKGALVTDVQEGSPADEGGLRAGDVIRELNHKPISNVSDLQSVVSNLKQGSTVLLNVVREGQTLFLAFDLS